VQLTAPSPGATVEGTVTVSAVASGNVSRVVLVLDGRRVTGSWGTTHSYAWKTVKSPNGVHRWVALAYNRSTRKWEASAPVDVTVNNVFSVQVTTPDASAVVGGTATVTAVASGNVSRVALLLDGVRVMASAGTVATYAWKTLQSGDGVHSWVAQAYNLWTRRWEESAPVEVTVVNDPSPGPEP
jgi:hypothetical protein